MSQAWRRAYKESHPYCELARYFVHHGTLVVPGKPILHKPLFGQPQEGGELHHIVGKDKRGRTDDEKNVLNLCSEVHGWITDFASCAGQVLCCVELQRQGRLDWAYLSDLDRKCWPGKFETDQFIEQCRLYPAIETLRIELIRKAA